MADLKARIIEHLETKGNFEKGVDLDMIDDLVDNTKLAKEIFKKLKEEGAVIYYVTTSGSTVSKLNPLLNAYQMTMRNVYQLASKLGINRNDRLKLKLIEKKAQDEFDSLMES